MTGALVIAVDFLSISFRDKSATRLRVYITYVCNAQSEYLEASLSLATDVSPTLPWRFLLS